jgi:ribosomal protein S18 acetylase RimI-like enzyme
MDVLRWWRSTPKCNLQGRPRAALPATCEHPVMTTAPTPSPELLARLERYYDGAPRSGATVETVGPFTLFVSTGSFPFYGRPRLGLTTAVDPVDVERLLDRQRAQGQPEAIEWVVETTPSLSDAARAAGLAVLELPLLVLDRPIRATAPAGASVRLLSPDEPDLDRIMAVAMVSFAHAGTSTGTAGPLERDELAAASAADRSGLRERLAGGPVVMAVAEDRDGPVASGAHQPLDGVTEVVGVATLPSARRRGLGTAVTDLLVQDALRRGLDPIFLSAASDEVARIYERLGFRRAATAGIASRPQPAD